MARLRVQPGRFILSGALLGEHRHWVFEVVDNGL